MTRPRLKRDPLAVVIVGTPGAPRTEADWTPEQREAAIRSLATVLRVLDDVPASVSESNVEITDREAA